LNTQPEPALFIRASNLSVRRGTEVLFKALNFELHSGQLVWLRGSNGSGKTSLLRVIAGLSRPDSGQVEWPAAGSDAGPRPLVYMGHANALKDDLTALESLRFITTIHHRSCTPAQMEDALRTLGVHHRRHLPVRMLSQGQRRRVALARLVLETQPTLWVLDEPFDALDDAAISTVHGLMRGHAERGGSVLFTSHIPVPQDVLTHDTLTLQPGRAA
jgi:heme exporter protein A